MVAWFALGLGLVLAGCLAWFALQRQRVALTPQPAPPPEPDRVELDDQTKLNLTTAWAYVMCQHCGTIHQGQCPRVRQVRYQANGNVERILYWPEGQWKPPPGSITAADIYGVAGPPPPEQGET